MADYQCARVNGRFWLDITSKFSHELILFYKKNHYYSYGITFFDMLERGLAKDILTKFPKYRSHTVFIVFTNCIGGGESRCLIAPRARFSFNASETNWFAKLKKQIIVYSGPDAQRVQLKHKGQVVNENNGLGILYNAKPYAIVAHVEYEKQSNIPLAKESPLLLDGKDDKNRIVEVTEYEVLLTGASDDFIFSSKTKEAIQARMNARMSKKAIRCATYTKPAMIASGMHTTAKKSKTTTGNKTKRPPHLDSETAASEEELKKERNGMKKSDIADCIAENIAAPLAEYVANNRKTNQKLLRVGNPVRQAINEALVNPTSYNGKLKPGMSIQDTMRRAGVKDVGRTYSSIADSIAERLATTPRKFLPRSITPLDTQAINFHAKEAYKKALIADGGLFNQLERFFDATERENGEALRGPTRPLLGIQSPVCKPEEMIEVARQYRHRTFDTLGRIARHAAYPEAYAHAICANQCVCGCEDISCGCKCYTPITCICEGCAVARTKTLALPPQQQQQQQQQSVIFKELFHKHHEEEDSEDEAELPRGTKIIITQQQQQEEIPVAAPKVMQQAQPSPVVKWESCQNFMSLFEEIYTLGFASKDRIFVFLPCDDAFNNNTLKTIEARINALPNMDQKSKAFIALISNYVVSNVPNFPKALDSVVQLKTESNRVFAINFQTRRIVNVKNSSKNCFFHPSIADRVRFPNATFLPMHILHDDVPKE